MNQLLKKLNIDETFTKKTKRDKVFTKISDAVTPIEGYNYMADLLYLPDDDGYKYLLVMTDVITHAFDIEPIKNKESSTVLQAMKDIFKRKYLKKPKASLRTDNGTEFKGVFHKYLYDNNIYQSYSFPYRHSQLSAVESLNNTLGKLFNGFMNAIEVETGKKFTEWRTAVGTVRTELNKIRYKKAPYTEKTIYKKIDSPVDMSKPPKFKVGDIVHRKLNYPEDALGNKQPTAVFRTGDFRWSSVPQEIVKVLYYSGKIPYRYMLDGIVVTS